MPALRPWLAGLLLIACSHTASLPTSDPPDVGPHDATPPVRLTLNDGADLTPAWRPDGSGILYGFESIHRRDRDRCIGVLPPGGGTRTFSRCDTADLDSSSVDALAQPAESPGGRLAWLENHSPAGAITPATSGIRVGTLGSTEPDQLVRSLPYPASSGRVHGTVTHLAWLGDTALVYVGAALAYPQSCSACPVDTLAIGREVVFLDPRTGVTTIAPGTAGATAVSPDGGALVLTLLGDHQVYRYDPATAALAPLVDFGGLGVVRDPVVRDSVLYAVAGGDLVVAFDSTLGEVVQRDGGGTLYRVDLRTGGPTALDLPGHLVRHPALAPDGRHLVVETADAPVDLYLLAAP